LSESLCLFSDQPAIWVDPVLSKSNNISQSADDNFESKIDLTSILNDPTSLIIKSPPQFGLTCLANYLVSEAWLKNKTWVYLDARTAKRDAVVKCVNKELRSLGLGERKVDCILLDSWQSAEPGAMKLLRNICREYKNTPIIVMQTIDDSLFKSGDEDIVINRKFDVIHLIALPRNRIRQVVCNYNDERKAMKMPF
jgi:hypothetical protein